MNKSHKPKSKITNTNGTLKEKNSTDKNKQKKMTK